MMYGKERTVFLQMGDDHGGKEQTSWIMLVGQAAESV